MAYIKLGSTKINYNVPTDKFIVSSILLTQSSYQYPVLVRDKLTLDIYFGRKFAQRNYYEELLDLGATLYLYKPISKVEVTDNPEIPDDLLPEFIPDDPSLVPDNFIIPENSKSWMNRSTLRLINNDIYPNYSYQYCYPQYGREYEDKSSITGVGTIDNTELDEKLGTLSFTIDFSNVESFFNPGKYSSDMRHEYNYYITLPINGGADFMIWFDSRIGQEPISQQYVGSYYTGIDLYTDTNGTVKKSREAIISEFLDIVTRPLSTVGSFPGLGYEIDKSLSSGDKYVIYKRTQDVSHHFHNLPGLVLEINERKSQDILSEGCESIKQLEFYSKVLGVNDEEISVKIEDLPYYVGTKYRITISSFDYSEVYDVNLNDTPDKNGEIHPLETTINKSSKLVRCHLYDRVNPLPTGTYYLRGAVPESYSYNEMRGALEIMKESEMNEDVMLVDSLQLWKSGDRISSDDLELFLDYAKYKDNQILITNRSYQYTDIVDGEEVLRDYDEFRYNLPDLDNRLVYFYNDLYYYDYWRPSYYVFLNGLLTDVYSVESVRVLYPTPDDSTREALKKYKSNYLTYNGLYYYYYEYFDADSNGDFNTEILTRFIVSKVGREFRRGKWNIISEIGYKKYRSINDIINSLVSSYSIIRSLTLNQIVEEGNTMTISLELKLGTLVNKDIRLDVELNYNS